MEYRHDACSEFMLPGESDIKISGRTMDWGQNLHSAFKVVPKYHKVTSYIGGDHKTLPKEGMSWETKYGFVGINAYGLPLYFDGLNEEGLSAALLFLSNTQYQEPQEDKNKNISMVYLLQYILGRCSRIKDVKDFLKDKTICGLYLPQLKKNQGVHLSVHDSKGHSLVIEAENGEIKQYDNNDNAVLTNSPFLHWHLENLRNYCNLTSENVSTNAPWKAFGNGSGMIGLPGDCTPPSRFVRISVLRKYSPISKTVNEGIQQAFHIINRITLVNGEVTKGYSQNDYTQWEVVRDHKNLMYYFRSNQNQSIRVIHLNNINFSGNKKYNPVHLTTGELYQDVTPGPLNN